MLRGGMVAAKDEAAGVVAEVGGCRECAGRDGSHRGSVAQVKGGC